VEALLQISIVVMDSETVLNVGKFYILLLIFILVCFIKIFVFVYFCIDVKLFKIILFVRHTVTVIGHTLTH
jgi:hypothetical protein